jgi:hypothetical protein
LTVLDDDTTTPVALETARHLHDLGWSPLPLPPRAKTEPPSGYTGYAGKYPTARDIEQWDARGLWSGNICIRMPADVIGVDVDVYHDGDVGLADLEAAHGKLPTTVWSTSREDGSGIALFRVPAGTTLAGNPRKGVELIQAHHRYMVVFPSIHPEGRLYQWVDEQSGELIDAPPPPDELPDLPWGWVTGLAVTKTAAAAAANPTDVREFIDAAISKTFGAALKGVENKLANYQGSRHDTLVKMTCWALTEAAAGLYPASEALEVLERWWIKVMDDARRRDGGEFGDVVCWAVAQVRNRGDEVERIRLEHTKGLDALITQADNHHVDGTASTAGINPETGEKVHSAVNLPDEFWNARPSLQHIRQAAHARVRSADAVLAFTLARAAALVPPTVKLPAITGGQASLNFLAGIISSSGGGKSSAGAVALELVPIDREDVIADVPLGSGEGMTELFFEMVSEEGPDGKQRKVKRQVKKGAFIYLDEGQALAEMGGRKGATLLPTLRAAWSGEVIGQSNASVETHRVLRRHSYRLAIAVGFQYEYAAALIDDAPGGTPQRFVFATATDPSVPDEAPEWPGELHIDIPPIISTGTVVEFDDEVATGIRTRARMAVRGQYEPDPLDSHADLVRMKVAALLAILDGRLYVSVEDWSLAGQVQRTSNVVRATIIERARQQRAREEAIRSSAMANRETVVSETKETRALANGARAIGRKAHRSDGTPLSVRELRSAVKGTDKQLAEFDEMLQYALERKWITPLLDGFTKGEGQPS